MVFYPNTTWILDQLIQHLGEFQIDIFQNFDRFGPIIIWKLGQQFSWNSIGTKTIHTCLVTTAIVTFMDVGPPLIHTVVKTDEVFLFLVGHVHTTLQSTGFYKVCILIYVDLRTKYFMNAYIPWFYHCSLGFRRDSVWRAHYCQFRDRRNPLLEQKLGKGCCIRHFSSSQSRPNNTWSFDHHAGLVIKNKIFFMSWHYLHYALRHGKVCWPAKNFTTVLLSIDF